MSQTRKPGRGQEKETHNGEVVARLAEVDGDGADALGENKVDVLAGAAALREEKKVGAGGRHQRGEADTGWQVSSRAPAVRAGERQTGGVRTAAVPPVMSRRSSRSLSSRRAPETRESLFLVLPPWTRQSEGEGA